MDFCLVFLDQLECQSKTFFRQMREIVHKDSQGILMENLLPKAHKSTAV